MCFSSSITQHLAELLENILQNLVCALLRNFDVMFSLAFGVFLHLA